MKLTQGWIEHLPDTPNKCGKVTQRTAVNEVCECGMVEQHTHCDGCGRIHSKGSGRVIAEWTIPVSVLR